MSVFSVATHDSSVVVPNLDRFAGKRVLITGGYGYLAANLTQNLKEIPCTIVLAGREKRAVTTAKGRSEVDVAHLDVRTPKAWADLLEGVDFVFHFAAQTSLRVAEEDPVADAEINVLPMLYLLETCRCSGQRPVVLFAGTATVCGMPRRLPVDDDQPNDPITVYDLHKHMAECYLKYYVDQGHVQGATLRLANVYGPGPDTVRTDRGILNRMIRKAIAGDKLAVYGAGDKLRDYVFVDDVARAFLMAATQGDRLQGRSFVIGTGRGCTLVEAFNLVADLVAQKTGIRVSVEHVPPPPNLMEIENRNFVANSSGFTDLTGWQPKVSLQEGIRRTVEAFVSHCESRGP